MTIRKVKIEDDGRILCWRSAWYKHRADGMVAYRCSEHKRLDSEPIESRCSHGSCGEIIAWSAEAFARVVVDQTAPPVPEDTRDLVNQLGVTRGFSADQTPRGADYVAEILTDRFGKETP